MEFNHFKDEIFEWLNEKDWTDLQNIVAHDKENTFLVTFQDGNQFELSLRQMKNEDSFSYVDKIRWEFFEKLLPKLLYNENKKVHRKTFDALKNNGQDFIYLILQQMCEEDAVECPFEMKDFKVKNFSRYNVHFIQISLPPYNPNISDIIKAYILYSKDSEKLYFFIKRFKEGKTFLLYVNSMLQVLKIEELTEYVNDMNYEYWRLAVDYLMILHDMQPQKTIQGCWSRDWQKMDWKTIEEKLHRGETDIGISKNEYLEFLCWFALNDTEIYNQTIFYLALKKHDFSNNLFRCLATQPNKLEAIIEHIKKQK